MRGGRGLLKNLGLYGGVTNWHTWCTAGGLGCSPYTGVQGGEV